jgi:L-2-hydroxycarboxylate dehydrogenase (NAD+)
MSKLIIDPAQLKDFCQKAFLKMGWSNQESVKATEVLVSADLRGIDSHGVARLEGYHRLWTKGRINSKAIPKIVRESPSTATMDADKGIGLIVAPKAMEIAIEKAQKVGTGWVAVKNSNHFGIAGFHAMMASKKKMIGIAMTNASPLVSPTFSTERMLGTNPIAIAIPSATYPDFVGDFATTTAANGKLEILQRENKEAPKGWVQDKGGNPSINPNELKDGGALLPLGGDREHGSHKGFILGSWVDIFSGVLSQANFGPWVPPFVSFLDPPSDPVGEGIGHFFGVMDIGAFQEEKEFLEKMDTWIQAFKNAKPTLGNERVVIPGEPELEYEKERSKNGIPVQEKVANSLSELKKELGIESDLF